MKKTVFITGGSRGIGASCVRKFNSEGWNVVFTYKKEKEAAEALVKELGDGNALALPLDLEKDDIRKILNTGRTYFGVKAYDGLVVNAGISIGGELNRMEDDQISLILQVNLKGAMDTVKYAIPEMIEAKAGNIVLISSMWGFRGASCESVYSATKSGLEGFGRSMALELAPSGIRVNMVAPGVINTDMNKGYSPRELHELKEATPLGRLGEPEDVAQAVYFLISEDSSFITGQVLGVDGGITV